MSKASDNVFPRFLISEGGSTATPAAGRVTVYAKANGLLYSKDDAGAETALGGGGGSATGGYIDAHGCRVKRASGNFSVGNNTLTVVDFNAEDFDTDTMHDNATNPSRITIPTISGVTTGLWRFSVFGYYDLTTADWIIRLNGATNITFDRDETTTLGNPLATCQYVCTAADYVQALGRTPGGLGAVQYDAGVSPIFEAEFLGKVT